MTDKAKRIVDWLDAYIKTESCHKVHMNVMAFGDYGYDWMWLDDICKQSIDLIESLSTELEQVERERRALSSILIAADSAAETYKRERDAFFESMKGLCATCKKARFCVLPPGQCPNGMWQWRGVREDV